MAVELETLDILGAGTAFKVRNHSISGLRHAVDQGLPVESIDILLEHVPKSYQKEARRWLGLQVTQDRGKLSQQESSALARLAYVLALSQEVWGSRSRSMEFLLKEHPSLDGDKPLNAAATEWGLREVEGLLRSIQFGLPA